MSKSINDCRKLMILKSSDHPHLALLENTLTSHRGKLFDWDDDDSQIKWLGTVDVLKRDVGGLIRKYRMKSNQTQEDLAKKLFHEGRGDPPGWKQQGVQPAYIAQFEGGGLKRRLGPIDFVQLSTLLGGGPLTELSDLTISLFGSSSGCPCEADLTCLRIAMNVAVAAGDELDEYEAHQRVEVKDNSSLADRIRREIAGAMVVENQIPSKNGGTAVWVAVIDGLRNYRRGRLHWVTAVAAFSFTEGTPMAVCASVYNPPTQELFIAFGDQGALVIDKKRNLPRKLPLISTAPSRFDVATHLSTQQPKRSRAILIGLEQVLPDCERIEMMSCGLLALCHVADGRIDAFANAVTKDRPASVLAGKIILEAAGGRVHDYTGAVWRVGSSGVVASSQVASNAHDLLVGHVVRT